MENVQAIPVDCTSLPETHAARRYDSSSACVTPGEQRHWRYSRDEQIHPASVTAKRGKQVAGILLPAIPVSAAIIRDIQGPRGVSSMRSMDRRIKATGFVDPYQILRHEGTLLDDDFTFVP